MLTLYFWVPPLGRDLQCSIRTGQVGIHPNATGEAQRGCSENETRRYIIGSILASFGATFMHPSKAYAQ